MSKQLDQTLYSLMPQWSTDLPPSLVDLAGSLLAQSRHKASTLKPQEEVARLYACAHIACDRLKISLDLPPIQPRPPIPPRNYRTLYAHLDNIIPQTATPAKTRAGRTTTSTSKPSETPNTATRTLPARGTPSKQPAVAQVKTPTRTVATPTRASARRNAGAADAKLRPWVKPVIRFICAEAKQEKLASSLVAGIETITIPGGRESIDEWVWENYTALLSAVCYWVFARAKTATTGHPIPSEPAYQQRREILSLLTQARKTVEVPGADDDDELWKYWADLKPRDFTGAVAAIADRSWLGDWWTGVDDVVNSADLNNHPVLDDEDTELAAPIRVRRADTMFQDRFDYLSDTRKADFKSWKQDMLTRITERRAELNAMDIDTQ